MTGSRMAWYIFMTVVAVGGAAAAGYEQGTLAAVLLAAAFFGGGWVIVDTLWQRRNDEIFYRADLVRERTKFTQAIAAADKDTRYFLAHEWPEMGVEFGEEGLAYLLKDGVNTGILLAFLKTFLEDSTENAFVDVRNYNDDKVLQDRFGVSREAVRAQWHLATEFLANEGFLKPDSMAGSRTWQWTGPEYYRKLVRRYVAGRLLERLT